MAGMRVCADACQRAGMPRARASARTFGDAPGGTGCGFVRVDLHGRAGVPGRVISLKSTPNCLKNES